MTFQQDIASKDLNIYPLVHILPHGYGEEAVQNGIFLSTRPVDMQIHTALSSFIPVKPILLNIPAISESIDVETKKYKISSVTLNISDYEVDGVRFSDSLVDVSGNSIINSEVFIYYVSQSRKFFAQAEDDLSPTQVGHFIVRDFKQTDSQVSLICEDRSQAELHKDLPIAELSENNALIDKYKDKPIPMVFGAVDKSPVLLRRINLGGDEVGVGVAIDSIAVTGFNGVYLQLGEYCRINDNLVDDNELDNIYFLRSYYINDIEENKLQVEIFQLPSGYRLKDSTDNFENESYNIEYQGELIGGDNILDDSLNTITELRSNVLPVSDVTSGTWNNVPNFFVEGSGAGLLLTFNTIDYSVPKDADGNFEDEFSSHHIIEFQEAHFNQGTTNVDISSETMLFVSPSGTSNYFNTQGQNFTVELDGGHENVSNPYSSVLAIYPVPISSSQATGTLKIKRIRLKYVFDVRKPYSKSFFADVTGRESSSPTTPEVIRNILTEELGFDPQNINSASIPYENWSLSFTVDKKINSKKLIEEVLQSSPYYGYFKDNKFNLYPQPPSPYSVPSKQINVDDVINYSYDRTPIEKVATRVNVKYYYDYGLKDYTKETGFENFTASEAIEGYNNAYYGIDNDQDLEFESKYIRTESSAMQLASYLLRQFCNQHNVFTVKLPLSYIEYSLSDLVKFDKLIEGKKAFGEDYTTGISRNGQAVFIFFQVIGVKKTLESVELKLYQLHDITGDLVIGCTDPAANNYDENATFDDGSCVYPEQALCAFNSGYQDIQSGYTQDECNAQGGVYSTNYTYLQDLYGCTDPGANNYDSGATWDNGSCEFPFSIGEFNYTTTITEYEFLQYTELPSATINIQWTEPQNASQGLETARYSLFVATSPESFNNPLYIEPNIFTTSFNIPVDELGLSGLVDVPEAFYVRVVCINEHASPNYQWCGYSADPGTDPNLGYCVIEGQDTTLHNVNAVLCSEAGGHFYPYTYGDFEFSTTILYEANPDDVLFAIDTEAGIAWNDVSYTELTDTGQISLTFKLTANSPEIDLDDSSYVQIRAKYIFQGNDMLENSYTSFMCKIRHLSSEQISDGEYKLQFIADEVYFTIWQSPNIKQYYGEFTAGGDYNDVIAANANPDYFLDRPPLQVPGDKIYYNIHQYDTPVNHDHWFVGEGEYGDGGNARYMIITNVFIKDNNTGNQWSLDENPDTYEGHSQYEPDYPEEGYFYVNAEVTPGVGLEITPPTTSYDIDGNGMISVDDGIILINIKNQIYNEILGTDYGLYTPISIDDPILHEVDAVGAYSLQSVWALLDMNGQAPAGQFCEQDFIDVADYILSIT